MKKRICAIAAALLIGLTGCAETKGDIGKGSVRSVTETVMAVNPDVTEGLVYDETDNTWAAKDESLQKLVEVMKKECQRCPFTQKEQT